MIPQNFSQWKKCITIDCGIPLTIAFAQQRLKVYENLENSETKKITQLYGEEHLDHLIQWFKEIAYAPDYF
ncbi:MAG: hypothetical protein ABJA37_07835 [Ferruginibacter sp.]